MKNVLFLAAISFSAILLTGCGPSKHETCTKLQAEASNSISGGRNPAEIRKDWDANQCTADDVN